MPQPLPRRNRLRSAEYRCAEAPHTATTSAGSALRAGDAPPTITGVQRIELFALAGIVLSGLAVVAARRFHAPSRSTRLQLALGLVPGVLGTFLVLVSRVDLVPDELEAAAIPVLVVLITVGAVMVTIYRFRRE